MHDIVGDCFIVVVDTDSYSGNFERQLVAYVTGHVGECGVGEEEAELADKELDAEGLNLLPEPLYFGEGCYSNPATIWPTPNYYNDGYGNHYEGEPGGLGRYPAYMSVAWAYELMPSESLLERFKQRAAKFCKERGITFTRMRVLRQETIHTLVSSFVA